MAKILVFGSTGNVGYEVAQALARKNIPFKAVVHDIKKSDKVKSLGSKVEVVQADWTDPASIENALVGIEKIFLMAPPTQTKVTIPFIETFKKAGIKHIVQLSSFGIACSDIDSNKTGRFDWAEEHKEVEDAIKSSGINHTSLRPTSFFSNLYFDSQSLKNDSAFYRIDSNLRMNFISNRDIGESAAIALTSDDHQGKIYNIIGQETYDYEQVAKLASEVLGRPIKVIRLSWEDFRTKVSYFVPPQHVDGYINMWKFYVNGGYDVQPHVRNDLEKLTGSKGQSMKDWLSERKADFN